MSGLRRIGGLALCLVLVSVAVVGGWSAHPPARAADTVDLPPGFIDAPENSVFLKSLAIPEDQLKLVLSMRDTTADGQPPFWAEVQALMIVEQERQQWEWALTETGAQHTYRDMVKQIKPILDLYTFLSKASIGWAYGSASIPGIIGDYLRVKKWVSTWNAVGDMMQVIDELRDLPDRNENDFIWFAAQEDVEVFPGNWDTLSILAPDMDEEEGMALAHHIYVVVNDDVEADKRELADKLHKLASHSGVTIADLRQLQADGVTRIQTGDKATGDEIVVSATIASPSAPVRLEVVTRTTRSSHEGSRNYETEYGPGGTVTLRIPLADYQDGEYVSLARAADQSGGASSWTSFGDNPSWNADFVVGDVVGNLTTAPTVKLTPKSDGDSPGIVLEWTAVAGAATYDIYRDNLLLYSTRTAGTTFWNTGLTPGRSYGYRVLGRNGCLRGPLSATVSAVAPAPDTSTDQARVVVNSNPVPLDVAPTNVSGSLLVPIRAISEALGAGVSWDQATQTVTLTLSGTVVKLVLGSKQATVNGQPATLAVAATMIGGRILVPLRFVSEAFGAEVAWKQETQTVVIIGRREGLFEVASPGLPALAAGPHHSLVIAAEGTVWAWGDNYGGQLGDGTTTDRLTPVQVQGMTDVVAIAGGGSHTIALRRDGTIWAWGWNSDGQLGDGTGTQRLTPVQVQGLADVVTVAAGYRHTVALRRDGTVWAWGENKYGQLGDGTTTNRSTPVQAQGLADTVAIAAGVVHTVALRRDGTLWAWGLNDFGQLGDGTRSDRSTPVQVQGLADVVTVAAGYRHTVALRRDGTVWAWGQGWRGRLGDGTTTDRSTPVQVQGLPHIGP